MIIHRCHFIGAEASDDEMRSYEERITSWRAASFAEATQMAETEAQEYAAAIDRR